MREHKVGIVGGSGFIGYALAGHLLRSFPVKILDIAPMPKDLEGNVEFRKCDIQRPNEIERGLEDVSLVIHTAVIQIPEINEKKRLGYEVNIIGTQNVCSVVDKNPSITGLILTGSWHVFGERGLKGFVDEKFGFRPDEVAERARLYALSKIAQEAIVRFYDAMSDKIFGIIRLGTVLGERMPQKTAANLFITKAVNGEPITPYKHSMYRPMLYIDINDVCKIFEIYVKKMLANEFQRESDTNSSIINVFWPKPITILELATMVRDAVIECSNGTITPKIEVVDTGQQSFFNAGEDTLIKVDISRAKKLLGVRNLTSPKESIKRLVRQRMSCGS